MWSDGHCHLLLEGCWGTAGQRLWRSPYGFRVNSHPDLGHRPKQMGHGCLCKTHMWCSQQPWPLPEAPRRPTELWSFHAADTRPQYRDEPQSLSRRVDGPKPIFLSDRARPTRVRICGPVYTAFWKRQNPRTGKHVGGLGWGWDWPRGDREANSGGDGGGLYESGYASPRVRQDPGLCFEKFAFISEKGRGPRTGRTYGIAGMWPGEKEVLKVTRGRRFDSTQER